MDNEKFVIYRPKKLPERLQGEYYNPPADVWTPSITYKVPLQEIKLQFTPAEAYRYKLQTSGKLIRKLDRIRATWERDFERWTMLVNRVKNAIRNYINKKNFRKLKKELITEKKQRDCYRNALYYFKAGDKEKTLEILEELPFEEKSVELNVMKLKILYSLYRFEECEAECQAFIQKEPENEDGYYIYVCCLCYRGAIQEAYKQMRKLFSVIDDPHSDVYKLNGMICMRLKPPKYHEAIISFDKLCYRHPEDMNVYLARASAVACIQNWDQALSDLNNIQKYNPGQPYVLYQRARVYACLRKWKLAKEDIDYIESAKKTDPYAYYGKMDLIIPYDSLPMIDRELLAQEDNA